MSELAGTLCAAIGALAAADPRRTRFGAAAHRYALAPPLSAAALAACEARLGAALPDELRTLVTAVGAGGAGPGYGVVPIDRAAAYLVTAPAGAPWRRGLPLAHLGCGYAAVTPLDGAARGQLWIDARAVGVVAPLFPDVTAWYIDWVDRLAHARWPDSPVPPGACALAAALSGYLARCEAELGLAADSLAGPALRDALGQLGPGAIEIAGASSVGWFADDDPVDPCLTCARLLDSLAASGLGRDVVRPGLPPRPLRDPAPSAPPAA